MRFTYSFIVGFVLMITVFMAPQAATADKAGDALLHKCASAMYCATTLQAEFSFQMRSDRETYGHKGAIKLKKPRFTLMQYPIQSNGQTQDYVILETGEWQTVKNPANLKVGRFQKRDWAWRNDWSFGNEYGAFYDPKALYIYAPSGSERKITGTLRVADTLCKALTISKVPGYQSIRYYIAPDGTLGGASLKLQSSRGVVVTESRLTNVKVNSPIADEEFVMPEANTK